jgi:hypothetical protein
MVEVSSEITSRGGMLASESITDAEAAHGPVADRVTRRDAQRPEDSHDSQATRGRPTRSGQHASHCPPCGRRAHS